MKKTLVIAWVLWIVAASYAQATIFHVRDWGTRVQSCTNGLAGSALINATVVNPGDLLAVMCSAAGNLSGGTPHITSVTDNKGGRWSTPSQQGTAGPLLAVLTEAHAPNHTQGAVSVNVNYAATLPQSQCSVICSMSEYSGMGATVSIDQKQSATDQTSVVTGITGTTISPNELLLAAGAVQVCNGCARIGGPFPTSFKELTDGFSLIASLFPAWRTTGAIGTYGSGWEASTAVGGSIGAIWTLFSGTLPTPTASPVPSATPTGPTPTPSATPATPTATPSPMPTQVAICPTGPNGVPQIAITGNLNKIVAGAAANQRVMYQWGMTQQPGNSINTVIPGGSSCSVFTDANGNLPTPPGSACTCFPQQANGYVTIGSGQPAKVVFPPFVEADISQILPVNAAMDPIVSEIDSCGSPSDLVFAISNPAIGTIGPATLCPGNVTGLQGFPICTTQPTTGQVLESNGTQWCPASIVTYIDAAQYGKFDARRCDDASITTGTNQLGSACAAFTSADAGKLIRIFDGPNFLGKEWFGGSTATIVSVAGGVATLSGTYPGATLTSNGTIIWATDDAPSSTTGINAAFLACPFSSSCIVQFPNAAFMHSTPIIVNGLSVDIQGQGQGRLLSFVTYGHPTTGTVDVGGTKAGDPQWQIQGNAGTRLHDFMIMGSALNMPSYSIRNVNASVPLSGPNHHNLFYNLTLGGLLSNMPGPGTATGPAMVGVCIGTDTTVNNNNDVSYVNNVQCDYAKNAGYQQGATNAVEWHVDGLHCQHDAVCIDASQGGAAQYFTNIESLDDALIFNVGQASIVDTKGITNEDDNEPSFAPDWLPSQAYAKHFVVEDNATGNLHMQLLMPLNPVSGLVQPTWDTHITHFTVTTAVRSANVVTVTTSTTHDFTTGQQVILTNTNAPAGAGTSTSNDADFTGIFTVNAGATANTFTYNQVGLNETATGGSVWHGTADGSLAWANIGASNVAQFALFASTPGGSGGKLHVDNATYAVNANSTNFVDQSIISGSFSPWVFNGIHMDVSYSSSFPPTLPPKIDLSANGVSTRMFTCHECFGINTASNVIFNSYGQPNATQGLILNVDRVPGINNTGPNGGAGSASYNVMFGLDPALIDPFRYDFRGKVRVMGGPLTVPQLPVPPLGPGSLTCSTSGSTTWYYEVTALTGGAETPPGPESNTFTPCANTVSTANTITGSLNFFVPGADHYCIYRSTAIGGSGSEKLALCIPADRGDILARGANAFVDTVPDASLGAVPPLPGVNPTGAATFGGPVQADSLTVLQSNQSTVANLPSYPTSVLSPLNAGPPGVYLKFNSNPNDSSGNGNNATWTGTPAYTILAGLVTDSVDKGAVLDGSTTFLTVPTSGTMPIGEPITECIAFQKFFNGPMYLFSQKAGGLNLNFDMTNTLYMSVQAGVNLVAGSVITDGGTHFVCAVKSGPIQALYVDGNNVSAPQTAGVTLTPADGTIYVGSQLTSPSFDGILDEAAVYKAALTQDQVIRLYHEFIARKNGFNNVYATDIGCTMVYTGGTWNPDNCGIFGVAGLPSAAARKYGHAIVTDNNAACDSTGYNKAPVAGGAFICPVFSNGSAWLLH